MSTQPYGSWRSPITAELIVDETVGLGQIVLDDDALYWSELRPAEAGRSVIVRRCREASDDILPAPFNARSAVHEYGGGAFTVDQGRVYFSNHSDRRVYRLVPGEEPQALTPPDARRYADLVVDRARRRLIAVSEDHGRGHEPANALVAIDLDGRRPPYVLNAGHDFYASPCLSADGARLAWIAWDHPHMPWDVSRLYLADLDGDGNVGEVHVVSGGPGESVLQPRFGSDGTLYFVSDRNHGWWNLYRHTPDGAEALAPLEAEFGGPQWVFGVSTYALLGDDRLVCAYSARGAWQLALLDLATRRLQTFPLPYVDIGYVQSRGDRVYFVGASPTQLPAVIELDVDTGRTTVVRRSTSLCLEPGYLSKPEAIEYATAGGERAHGFYYRPRNHDVDPPEGELPPLLVMCHGGPTAATSAALSLKVQYWTSRGFGVLDVNYLGSTGYGRAYRERLYGGWGVVDVEDCVHGARELVRRGLVDPRRLAIRGSSAGGFTTLCALTFHDVFAAGASLYGISDLETLARDTHKFEAHYLDRLVGPYPAARAVYRERSPIHHAERLSRPVIFFQGLDDRVVPREQAERLVGVLRRRRIPVAYVCFPGEGHGFRQAANIRRALEGELYFYGRFFGFTPADRIDPVPIEHLP